MIHSNSLVSQPFFPYIGLPTQNKSQRNENLPAGLLQQIVEVRIRVDPQNERGRFKGLDGRTAGCDQRPPEQDHREQKTSGKQVVTLQVLPPLAAGDRRHFPLPPLLLITFQPVLAANMTERDLSWRGGEMELSLQPFAAMMMKIDPGPPRLSK
jgi:hypothetical protein